MASIPEELGGGLDALSPENKIKEGHVEDIENMDPTPEGSYKKRSGYESYAGYIPLRVSRFTQSGTEACFYFDSSVDISSVDLASVRSTPLVAYGKTTQGTGEFTETNTSRYYPGFTIDSRRDALVGTNNVAIPQTEHGIDSSNIFLGFTTALSTTNSSNSIFIPDEIAIDENTFDIAGVIENNTASAFEYFAYWSDKSPSVGETYVEEVNLAPGAFPYTITAATHQLTNTNILFKLFEKTGTEWVEIEADTMQILTNGDVTVDLTATLTSDYKFLLSRAAATNEVTGTAASGVTTTVLIENLTSPFLFAECYLEDIGSGIREQVIPDSIVISELDATATVSFVNNTGTTANFSIFWEEARLISNKLCVTATTSATVDEYEPQLTIWGLSQSDIYGSAFKPERAGWTNHIDSYRSLGEGRLICGLGGNIFRAAEKLSTPTAFQETMPLYYPKLRGRVDSDINIAPAFGVSARTRGYIDFIGADQGWGRATSITFDESNGWVKYSCPMPSLNVSGTLSTIISTSSGLEDYLTVRQAGYGLNNGDFKIRQVVQGTDSMEIWVENSESEALDWDEINACAQIGIFTDRLSFLSDVFFNPGDVLQSDLFGDAYDFSIVSASSNIAMIEKVLEPVEVPSGLRFVASRTSRVIPLRELDGTSNVENLVAGDYLTYTGIARHLKVVSVNPSADENVTLTGDGETTVIGIASSLQFRLGNYLLLSQAGEYSGTYEITGIPDETSLEISTTLNGVKSAVLVGKYIEVNEELAWEDSLTSINLLSVNKRWIPIEAPEVTATLPKKTYYRHFDALSYSEQPILRSVMVNDNMYFTNGQDEVMKYDGVSLYRAGLPRWQPQLFASVKPSTAAKIILPSTQDVIVTANAVIGDSSVQIDTDKAGYLSVTNKIKFANHDTVYTIVKIEESSTAGTTLIWLGDSLVSDVPNTTNLNKVYERSYYFKLNAIDANSNVTSSAVIGVNDFTVQLSVDSSVEIKIVGMPLLDNYDYDNLELEIYGTKLSVPGDYYRLTTLPLPYEGNDGYVLFSDTVSDDELVDIDAVNVALLGAEVGTQWRQPLRASYITSVDNRLVLGNVKDYPKWTIELARAANGGPVENSDLSSDIYLFKKSSVDTSTDTDIINRIGLELFDTPTVIDSLSSTLGTSFTITDADHTVNEDDWVYLFRDSVTSDYSLEAAGWYQAVNVTGTTFDILDANAPASPDATNITHYVASQHVPVYLGTDGNYGTSFGNVGFSAHTKAAERMSNAINAVMRIYQGEGFEPWLISNAGSDYGSGVLEVIQPRVFDTTASLTLPSFSNYQVFIHDYQAFAGETFETATRVYPSRVLYSYQNYPEIFDNPLAVVAEESNSAIDANSSDGQQITGEIPFYALNEGGGAGAFLVTLKTNSIYVSNLSDRSGQPLQAKRLDSRGIGCTAPFSVASTRNGIAFANESGIYKLTRNLQVEYFGDMLERKWRDLVSQGQIGLATGHYYSYGNKYKLSFTSTDSSSNDQAWVYDTVREDEGRRGSWTRYTNHHAIGWANLGSSAYFASTTGEVFQIRTTGESSDYRDDSNPVDCNVTFKAQNFGSSSQRKIVDNVVFDFKAWNNSAATVVKFAQELRDSFEPADNFKVVKNSEVTSGLDTVGDQKVSTIRFSAERRRVVYFQIQVVNEGLLDDELEITGLTYNARPLNEKGIIPAQLTTTK